MRLSLSSDRSGSARKFVIAQMHATDGYRDEALAELQAVRPLLADAFGP
jgi:hypothetical protein